MTAREQHRAWVLAKVLTGELTMIEGAERVGLSERHLWRLRTAFERAGPAGLVHGNRGRPSARRIDERRRVSIIELRLADEALSTFPDALHPFVAESVVAAYEPSRDTTRGFQSTGIACRVSTQWGTASRSDSSAGPRARASTCGARTSRSWAICSARPPPSSPRSSSP